MVTTYELTVHTDGTSIVDSYAPTEGGALRYRGRILLGRDETLNVIRAMGDYERANDARRRPRSLLAKWCAWLVERNDGGEA